MENNQNKQEKLESVNIDKPIEKKDVRGILKRTCNYP